MIQVVLLALGAASPTPDASIYAAPRLEALLQLGSGRVIDGLEYLDSEGMALAALRFSHPDGFHAASQLGFGRGNGRLLPDRPVRQLESAVGWAARLGESTWSLDLQDYRLDADGLPGQDHQALATYLDHGPFSIELAFDREQPYYVAAFDAFLPYDSQRLAASWMLQSSSHWALTVSLGYKAIDDVDVNYPHAGLRLDWQQEQAFVSLAWVRAGDAARDFYGDGLSLDSFTVHAGWRFDLSGAID